MVEAEAEVDSMEEVVEESVKDAVEDMIIIMQLTGTYSLLVSTSIVT